MPKQPGQPSLIEDLEGLGLWLKSLWYYRDADICMEAIKEIERLRMMEK